MACVRPEGAISSASSLQMVLLSWPHCTVGISLHPGLLDPSARLEEPSIVQLMPPNSSPVSHHLTWLRSIIILSAGQTALNTRACSLCSAAAHYGLRAAANQCPASIPAAGFFLSLGCYKQHQLQLQKQPCFPAQVLSSSAGSQQTCAPPAQERSVHPSAWASRGMDWTALGDGDGSVVSQKLFV